MPHNKKLPQLNYLLGNSLKSLFLLINYFNWRLITLQYCSGFSIHWHESAVRVHVSPRSEPLFHLPPHPIPFSCSSALFYALNLNWSSISHMVIYMFQYYSLKSSCPLLLPQSPKICSLYLCLLCCLTYNIIIAIFLNSIHMCWYNVLVFFFLLTSLYIIGSSFIYLIITDLNVFFLIAE